MKLSLGLSISLLLGWAAFSEPAFAKPCEDQLAYLGSVQGRISQLEGQVTVMADELRPLLRPYSKNFNIDESGCTGNTDKAKELVRHFFTAKKQILTPQLLAICRDQIGDSTDVSLLARLKADKAAARALLIVLGEQESACEASDPGLFY